jgi:hypothetical protein
MASSTMRLSASVDANGRALDATATAAVALAGDETLGRIREVVGGEAPLTALGWRRRLGGRGWLRRRRELCQRRAGVEARGGARALALLKELIWKRYSQVRPSSR